MMNMTNEDMNELLMPFGLALMTNDKSANGLFEIVDQQHHIIDVRCGAGWECGATYVSVQHMAYALCELYHILKDVIFSLLCPGLPTMLPAS